MFRAKTGIYYLTSYERAKIEKMDGAEKRKWDKRMTRPLEAAFYIEGSAGPNRAQRRRMKFRCWWRDGTIKTNSEHRTKHIQNHRKNRKRA